MRIRQSILACQVTVVFALVGSVVITNLAMPRRASAGVQIELVEHPTRTPYSIGDAESRGAKAVVVKAMTKLLAKAIREGGKYAAWVLGKLDKQAARAFRKHSKSIANQLDEIAKIPDLTTRIVKEKLFYFLNGTLGLSGGTSMVIADAVKGVLDVLVF